MKQVSLASLCVLALFSVIEARATPITFNDPLTTSTTGVVVDPSQTYGISFQSSINGTSFSGQSVQLDLSFSGFFIRTYSVNPSSHNLGIDLFLPYLPFWGTVFPPPDVPNITGTVSFLDAFGVPIGGGPVPLSVFNDGGPSFQPDLQLFAFHDFGLAPVDIYGLQYDLVLSDSPGKTLAVAPRMDFLSFQNGLFGVGPGVPASIVPDDGSGLGLLLLGVTACIILKRKVSGGHQILD
jgi:hypothetical protein